MAWPSAVDLVHDITREGWRPCPRSAYRRLRVERLRHVQIRGLLDFVADAEAAALSDRGQVTELIVAGLGRLIPSDITLVTDWDARSGQCTTSATDPALAALRRREPELWQDCLRHHPSVAHYDRCGSGAALRFSDLISRAGYRRLPVYQYFFRPVAVEFKLDARIYPTPGHMDLGCCRERRDFDVAERALLDALRPYLAAIMRRADAGSVAGRLRAAFGLTPREGEVLALLARGRSNREVAATLFLSTGTVRKHLEHVYAKLGVRTRTQAAIRALEFGIASGPAGVKAGEMLAGIERVELTRFYTLTEREVEVLALASDGRTNGEIAMTLRIAPETVKKHLDHVFAKLGVGRRGAAASRALSLGLV
jgi:DNA-binding CsgD family transcriptional regulator